MLFIKRKKVIIIISIFLILISLSNKKVKTKKILKIEYTNIININNKERELLTISIPRINLVKEVYSINSNNNNIKYNIQILSSSNINTNTFILASHSGTNKNAYFNNLYKLRINDIIYIIKDKNVFTYQINNIYYINKTGFLEIERNIKNKLILITCSTKYKNKQLIIKSNLINISNVK